MEQWILPCNAKYFDIESAFKKLKRLNWKQSAKSIKVGDEVFIYVGLPVKAIKYRCKVNKVNLEFEEIDDEKYSLEVLKSKGTKGNIQGPRRAMGLVD